MKKYFNFPDYRLENNGYELISVREEDIEKIRLWRNEQIAVLRQNKPISKEEQQAYYKTNVFPSFLEKEPKQILVSILYEGKLVGYGGLVHISWEHKRAEVSFLNDTNRNYPNPLFEKDLSNYLDLIKNLAFDFYYFNKLTTEMYDIRPYFKEIIEAKGFALEGRLKNHVVIDNEYIDSLVHGCFRV